MPDDISNLSRLIQLAVAPVFLLTGIGAMLSVMTQRLARVIDRARALDPERRGPNEVEAPVLEELRSLHHRMHLINRAVQLCTYAALLVASVIAALFLSAVLGFDLTPEVALAFVVAMLLLIGGLVCFLREVHVATRYMREVFRLDR